LKASNYRANEEAIKKEEWFHKYKAGPYRKMTDSDAGIMFIERIEGIISADIVRMTNISKEDGDENNIAPNPEDESDSNGLDSPESGDA